MLIEYRLKKLDYYLILRTKKKLFSYLESIDKMRDKSKHLKDKAILLRADGNTLKSISHSLGISLSTVRRYIA